MDDKMKKLMDTVYENMTDEQKEKAKACETSEELMEYVGKEGIELPDDLVDAVAGGCSDSGHSAGYGEDGEGGFCFRMGTGFGF